MLPSASAVLFDAAPETIFAKLVPLNAAGRRRQLINSRLWGGNLTELQSVLGTALQRRPSGMLLLEDIDVFHAAARRDDDAGSITLSGLLNALDGIATPHGLLTVLTTNTPEVLDHAVVRAGRMRDTSAMSSNGGPATNAIATRSQSL